MTAFRRFGRVATLPTLAVMAALLSTGCDEPRSSPRPSASLLEVEFTPQATPAADSSSEPTTQPTFLSLPVGWDGAFCAVFADAVVAQELVIDVERALDEENVRDARLLARELRETTAHAATLLVDVPEWEPAQQVTQKIATLIDLGARAGEQYGAYFADDLQNALRRARNLRRDIGNETPAANELLAGVETLGITCKGLPLRLEEF